MPLVLTGDHLHIRGEYTMEVKNAHKKYGSPPHTWRILNSFTNKDDFEGITSTYVENTNPEF